MPLSRLEIIERSAYAGGRRFGAAGSYERIDAIAHYAVSPDHAANRGIVDLALAERGVDGLVHFSGDVTVLLPATPAAGNRALLMQVPNRGKRLLARFNMSPLFGPETADVDPGDGFLFVRGWTIAWAGWQWDVPRTPERTRIGLQVPSVPPAARVPPSRAQLRFQPNAPTRCLPLTDQHVGDLGNHELVRAADPEDPDATLLVRDGARGDAREIPRAHWRFAREEDGRAVADDGHLWLEGGFAPGRIYDLLYTPRDCPVVGAGLLATRDLATFLRHAPAAPTAGTIDHVIAEGQSQCGRFLRTFLQLGLNRDEAGHPAFDGMLAHIAGGRRGEFNHRYAQPSVQPTPSFGHLFPFSDVAQHDPLTGRTAGLLDAQRADGGLPKVIYTDTSSEYWRGDAGLAHTELDSDGDCEPPPGVRRYLFASTQHGPGSVPLTDSTVFGSRGANAMNIVDYRPLYRAALVNLLAWVADGTAPPASVFPRAATQTRSRRARVLDRLAAIPGLVPPAAGLLTTMYPLDLGPRAADGIATLPARLGPESYPDWVSAVDGDGNETGGLRMPDIAVPVATHTGFNPRHPETGGAGQLLEYVGSSLPFAVTAAERSARGDPRPALAERYGSRDDYLDQVRAAADALVGQRYLLAEDVGLCVDIAAVRYDACASRS